MNITRHVAIICTVSLILCISVVFAQEQWTLRNPLPTDAGLHSVIWTGSQLVSVGSYGTILTSPDGIDWTKQSSASMIQLSAITCTDTLLVAVGGKYYDSSLIMTSPMVLPGHRAV